MRRLVFLATVLSLLASCDRSKASEPVVVNPNGGWSWFGDERAVVDVDRGVLYVGSLANHAGAGGAEKDGDVEVARVDLATGAIEVDVLHDALLSYGGGDDHNCPSMLVLPDGRVLAAYAGHNNAPITYFRTFDPETGVWDEERTFDWNAAIEGGSDFACTYNNLFYLPADGTVVNISRNHRRCPNVIVSHDLGATWEYAGQLLQPSAAVGAEGLYVNGYLKYSQWGDRIDLLATERHPRNYSNNLYHGYLARGRLHSTDGAVVDDRLDAYPQAMATDLTRVFAEGAKFEGISMTHSWMLDFEHYPDGTLATVFKARADDSVEDHRFFYGVYRDGEWSTHYLGKAGPRLFYREEDYTGLAALDPNDPGVLYISTPIDPTSGETTPHHEIYRGDSGDGGKTWAWRAVTADSDANNLRPIIPRWAPGRTALIWNRGTMASSQNYDQEVVLLIDPLGGE